MDSWIQDLNIKTSKIQYSCHVSVVKQVSLVGLNWFSDQCFTAAKVETYWLDVAAELYHNVVICRMLMSVEVVT